MSPPASKVFPIPYQIDFTVESKGRHLDSTKRKITWKFGFAHPPSVFPHLFDKDENYIGENNNGTPSNDDAPHKKGAECRGREHEIILVWSILTNKAHIYVNSQEIFRLDSPHEDYINLNPFSGSFRRGFNLPNAKYNGKHRIDIRCYARTPIGAKNMIVDDAGGKFRQYELTVDGQSFFSFPALYELGTQTMWHKLSRWRMMSSESQGDDTPNDGHQFTGNNNHTGRLQDEYYFAKHNGKSDRSITKSERRAMAPRTESDEERMTRIAMEASLRDIENESSARSHDKRITLHSSSSHEENNVLSGNRQFSSRRPKLESKNTSLVTVGEDDNLIDFGEDDDDTPPVGGLANGVSQISFSPQTTSDVSVLADDDATTASFMMKQEWNNPAGQQATTMPNQMSQQANVQFHYRDPTFAPPPQRPWNTVGTISSNPAMNARPGLSSDVSFAVPPAPTLADFKDAFGSSTMSMAASNPMSPASTIGMYSPTALRGNWQNQPRPGAPPSQPAPNQFDPLRSDPFASY